MVRRALRNSSAFLFAIKRGRCEMYIDDTKMHKKRLLKERKMIKKKINLS